MWNAEQSICSTAFRWDAMRATHDLGVVDRRRQGQITVLENFAEIRNDKGGTGDMMYTVAKNMREWEVCLETAQPLERGPWKPERGEYHPQVSALAKRAEDNVDDEDTVVIGSDGGVLPSHTEDPIITAGLAIIIRQEDGRAKRMQTGFLFKGNPTSFYAEAVAMEAMLYVGWRITQRALVKTLKMVSDSQNNVDMVKAVAAGGEVKDNNTTPTRTYRMAELLLKGGGVLQWVRGHQDHDDTDEAKVNDQADKQATAARKDGIWDPHQWAGRRPARYQRSAILVGDQFEAERRAGRQLRELGYRQLHDDIEEHVGMPAVSALRRPENLAMLRIRFNGVWAKGHKRRDLLRQCRAGGWGDFRTRANGKCIGCGKAKPTITHCLTACALTDEFANDIDDKLEEGGITKMNVSK
eukprot:gene11863-biopygen8559